jgi:MFS family permease
MIAAMNGFRKSSLLLAVIYLGFISLGLPDGTFGLAWTAIYKELSLPVGLAGTILIIGTLISGSSGFMSGRITTRFGTGPVVFASCLLTGAGMVAMGFANAGYYLYLVVLPLGIGAGAVDASLNSFVARHYSGRHMNWLHACWGIGATVGPLWMGACMSSSAGWRGGYWSVGSVQLLLAVLFLVTLGLWKSAPELRNGHEGNGGPSFIPIRRANSMAGYLSMLSFVFYVGVETMTGLWIATILVVGRNFSPEVAALCTASYYASITGGRILVGFIVDRFGNRRLINAGMLTALLGSLLFVISGGPVLAFVAIILIGGGFAPVYPCLMHEVPRRFAPDDVSIVIGRQTGASYIGAALMPVAGGWFAQNAMAWLPWLTVLGALALIICVRSLDKATPDGR